MGKRAVKSSYAANAAKHTSELLRLAVNMDRDMNELHEREYDDEKPSRQEKVKEILNYQTDYVASGGAKKKKRVGTKKQSYLGARVTKVAQHSPLASELIDFISDPTMRKYGLYMPVFGTLDGSRVIAMEVEFYGKHNRPFYSSKDWLLANAFFLKYYFEKFMQGTIILKNIRQEMFKSRQYLVDINRMLGLGFIPRNYMNVQVTLPTGKLTTVKQFVGRVPIKDLRAWQDGFILAAGNAFKDEKGLLVKTVTHVVTAPVPQVLRHIAVVRPAPKPVVRTTPIFVAPTIPEGKRSNQRATTKIDPPKPKPELTVIEKLRNESSNYYAHQNNRNNRKRVAKFGKKFSSDTEGDGPAPKTKDAVVHYLNSIPLDSAITLYERWKADYYYFRNPQTILEFIFIEENWMTDEISDDFETAIENLSEVPLRHFRFIFNRPRMHTGFAVASLTDLGLSASAFLNGANGEWTGSDDVANIDIPQMTNRFLSAFKNATFNTMDMGGCTINISDIIEKRVYDEANATNPWFQNNYLDSEDECDSVSSSTTSELTIEDLLDNPAGDFLMSLVLRTRKSKMRCFQDKLREKRTNNARVARTQAIAGSIGCRFLGAGPKSGRITSSSIPISWDNDDATVGLFEEMYRKKHPEWDLDRLAEEYRKVKQDHLQFLARQNEAQAKKQKKERALKLIHSKPPEDPLKQIKNAQVTAEAVKEKQPPVKATNNATENKTSVKTETNIKEKEEVSVSKVAETIAKPIPNKSAIKLRVLSKKDVVVEESESEDESDEEDSVEQSNLNDILDIYPLSELPDKLPAPIPYKRNLADIKISAAPKSVALFTRSQMMRTGFVDGLKRYDCGGAPFCGYVSIHMALAGCVTEKNVDAINALISTYAPESKDGVDRAYSVGVQEFLGDYARTVGLNLLILTRAKVPTPLKFGKYNVVYPVENDRNFKWVVLCFEGHSEVGSGFLGHYVLLTYPGKEICKLRAPTYTWKPNQFFFFIFGTRHTVLKHFQSDNERDDTTRPPNFDRDKIEKVDTYAMVKEENFVAFRPQNIKLALSASVCLTSLFFSPLTAVAIHVVAYGVSKAFDVPSEFVYEDTTFPISVLGCHMLLRSTELKQPDEVAHLTLMNTKNIDSDSNIPDLFYNTSRYMRAYGENLHRNRKSQNIQLTKPETQYNTPSSLAVVTDKNQSMITEMLSSARKLYGGGNLDARNYPNHITKIAHVDEPTKVGVAIATAPIDCIWSNGEALSPGMLPVSDQTGIVLAFCTRSMSKAKVEDNPVLLQFEKFFKEFYQEIIDEIDLSDIVEQDDVEYFRQHYTGKRPKLWIDGMVEGYTRFLENYHNDNYDENGAFVKLENAAKDFGDGVIAPKWRLIMTMSPVTVFQTVQFLKVVDRWNDTSIKQYQIKHEEMGDMIKKIQDITDQHHNITDYSSFECSVIGVVRACEDWLILELLKKAGLDRARKSYKKRVCKGRYLKNQGVTMFINSRCSGDYHTSFGNGCINIAIAMFCAKMQGVEGSIIAEGDDGITPAGVMNVDITSKLGFSFSEDILGHYPGDADFLQRRFRDGKIYLNIAKTLSVFWVKNKANLGHSKQMFILRCMGSSLHHMSPGHPVLCSIVNRIGRLTSSYRTPFKNWFLHINLYEFRYTDVDNYPRHVVADDSMRSAIAEGALGFPPIPIIVQQELERMIDKPGRVDIGCLLDDYPQIALMKASCNLENTLDNATTDSVSLLFETLHSFIREASPRPLMTT